MNVEDIKLLDFNGLKFRIDEVKEGEYNILTSSNSYILSKNMGKEDIIEYSKSFNRKIQLFEQEGFEEKSSIELSSGFRRINYLYKIEEGVSIFIYKNLVKNYYEMTCVKRHNGKDYIYFLQTNTLDLITNEEIRLGIERVKTKIRLEDII